MDDLYFGEKHQKESFLSEFTDPFKMESIECVRMYIRKTSYGETKITFKATVDFSRGKTKGEHEIMAMDFPTLVKKVESFIKEL